MRFQYLPSSLDRSVSLAAIRSSVYVSMPRLLVLLLLLLLLLIFGFLAFTVELLRITAFRFWSAGMLRGRGGTIGFEFTPTPAPPPPMPLPPPTADPTVAFAAELPANNLDAVASSELESSSWPDVKRFPGQNDCQLSYWALRE